MRVTATSIADVLIVEPKVFGDPRGFFFESFNQRDFNAATGTDFSFVQDNHSRSEKGVLRGLHYQSPHPQGKLIRVLRGTIFDVVLDIRKSSRTFGEWVGIQLTENSQQLWVPPGFAHGFLVLSDSADVFYKVTEYYDPLSEWSIAWDDATAGIHWPLIEPPILSGKDAKGHALKDTATEIFNAAN